MAFGIDDAIGMGIGALGGVVNNLFAGARQEDAQQFNLQQMYATQQYNSAEAVKARDFNREEAQKSREFNSFEAGLARDFAADQVLKAQDFSERMSNTSWQRGVADMRAAGINPILAFSKGGASAPVVGAASGSAASGGAASSGAASSSAAHTTPAQVFDVIGPAVSTALRVQELDNLRAEEALKRDQGMLTRMQGLTETQRTKLVAEQTDQTSQEARRLKNLQGRFLAEGMKGDIETGYYGSTVGKAAHIAGLGAQSVRAVMDAVNPIKGLVSGPKRSTSESTTNHFPGGSSTFTERFGY